MSIFTMQERFLTVKSVRQSITLLHLCVSIRLENMARDIAVRIVG